MRGEPEVESLSLSDSALSAARQSPQARSHGPCDDDNDTGRPDGVTSEGARAESDSWAER